MDFATWIPLDLDLIGYRYPFNLDPIGLDLLDRKLEDNPNPIGLVERNGRTIAAAAAAFGRWPSAVGPQAALLLNPHGTRHGNIYGTRVIWWRCFKTGQFAGTIMVNKLVFCIFLTFFLNGVLNLG